MTVKEIAEAIGMSVRHIAEIPKKATIKSKTLTSSQLDDLVDWSLKLPFSIFGYELSSQIAAAVRRSDMEEWWRILRRYNYRSRKTIAHAKLVATKALEMNEHDDWGMEAIDWDLVVFSYHYLLINSLLSKRLEDEFKCLTEEKDELERLEEGREEFECLEKEKKRYKAIENRVKTIEGRVEFLGSIDVRRTEQERELISTALVKMLRNWREFNQTHIWTRILEFKVLTNLVAVKWEKTPREERASPKMRDYLKTLEYEASLESYSKVFPGEIAPLFNLLAIASRFGDVHLYRQRYFNLCNAGEEGRRFMDLHYLEEHPDADGDMDNFISYWRAREDH